MDPILAGVAMQIIGPLLGTIATIFLPIAGVWIWRKVNHAMDIFERKTGIEIDTNARETLHSAIQTGLKQGVSMGLRGTQLSTFVNGYIRQSSPGSLKRLNPTGEVIGGLMERYLPDALASVASGIVADAKTRNGG